MSPTNPNSGLETSCEALLYLAFQQVDESMLREIAEADYGEDADSHLAALRAIKAGKLSAPLNWYPREVLELIRWSEPEDPTWKPGSIATRGHWIRLFSCAVLLRFAAEPEGEGCFLSEDSTIIQLVDSAIKLGHEASLAALQFLRWRAGNDVPIKWGDPFSATAILFLSVSLGVCDDEMATSLIAAANSGEKSIVELLAECQKAETWRNVANRTLTEAAKHSEEIKEFCNVLKGSAA